MKNIKQLTSLTNIENKLQLTKGDKAPTIIFSVKNRWIKEHK